MNALLSDNAVVRGDSTVYPAGEGYERVIVYSEWDAKNPRRLAKAAIRVDRRPENSFAHISVWVPATGWNIVHTLSAWEFWPLMPGYTRGRTDRAARETLDLSDEMLDQVIEMGV